jgi:peroxiredoxin
MLSVQTNLGDFLNSLLRAPNPTPIFRPGQTFQLAYTKVDIHAAGIVLHGSLSVTDQQLVNTLRMAFSGLTAGWPPAHVEYEQIPAIVHQGVLPPVGLFPQGPDYSALKSWIPGGTVQQYEWSRQGQTQPFVVDPNRFVLISSESEPPETMYSAEVVPAYAPLCLTVRGTRLSASGPVVPQPVSATLCGYSRMPVIDSGLLATLDGALPMLALTQPGTGGGIVVTGHTPAQSGNAVPNLLVHFADDQTAGQLEIFTRALRDNKRKDAVVAVLAVLSPEQLSKARHTQDVIYADNQDGAWERVFQVKTARRPLTLIVGQKGGVAWRLEGIPDAKTLAAAVGKYLMPGGSSKLEILQANVRIGQPAPNFLFEFAPGRQLTLRKLAGRPAILVFWRTSSQPSIEAIRALQQGADKAGVKGSAVLAINDGEAADLAKRVALGNGLSATLVTDPKREISLAYGVSLWPTVVYIDASGSITGISYGYFTGEHGETPSAGRTAA